MISQTTISIALVACLSVAIHAIKIEEYAHEPSHHHIEEHQEHEHPKATSYYQFKLGGHHEHKEHQEHPKHKEEVKEEIELGGEHIFGESYGLFEPAEDHHEIEYAGEDHSDFKDFKGFSKKYVR